MEEIKQRLSFAAINQYVDSKIIAPTEKVVSGKGWIQWGTRNMYPDYLHSLYKDVGTLQAIIDGCVDYTVGDGVAGPGQPNSETETWDELCRDVAHDWWLHGGFAIQVIRDNFGRIAEVYPLHFRDIRLDKEAEAIYYCEDWYKGKDVLAFPRFVPEFNQPESVLAVRRTHYDTYPTPVWASAVKSAEIERSIDDFHLSSIENGFFGSYLINLHNSGQLSDQEMDEVERDFTEKFTGSENAGRVMFAWSPNKDSYATVQKIDIQDYGEKYQTLANRARSQLFTAFRANPNLFGLPTENLGFNSEEYDSTFMLFNRTMIRPAQRVIVDALAKIYGPNTFSIQPFNL